MFAALPIPRQKSYWGFYANSYDNSFLRSAGHCLLMVLVVLAVWGLLKAAMLLFTRVEAIKLKAK